MARAGQSGMIYDFFTYGRKHSAGAKKCGAEEFKISATTSKKTKLSVIF